MSERIGIDPDMGGGKPTVAGTRISVQTGKGHLSAGDEVQDVLGAYTRLTWAAVLACLEYAARSISKTSSPPSTLAPAQTR